MISEAIEPRRWPPGRWWARIALVLAVQLGLIFWLGKPQSRPPARVDPVPVLKLSRASSGFDKLTWDHLFDSAAPVSNLTPAQVASSLSPAQVMALADPTLFALPHRQGFSGLAWLTYSPPKFSSFEWSEAPRWLELGEDQLGSEFKDFMATNQFDALPALQELDLTLKLPAFQQSELPPVHSRLWFAGALASRSLLKSPELPSWRSADLLTNSVVQLWVAADGTTRSATLLKTRDAPNEADAYALREARKFRFAPVVVADSTDPMAGLTWGQAIFEWHTLPQSTTNSPAQPALPK